MDTKGGAKKSASAGRLIRVLALQQRVARASLLVAAHVSVDLNVIGDIPSCSFVYSKQFHCTNDSEFLSLINSKFPLPHQRYWQGSRLSFAFSTKVISELGTKASPMGEWKRLRQIGKSFVGSGVPVANPLELTYTWTSSSPRRTFFLHALSFDYTSKLYITFLNQFSVYSHILKMHYII